MSTASNSSVSHTDKIHR